jgi:hypothetical protein
MKALEREIAMQKTLRKLVFLPVLVIVFAALAGMPEPAAAARGCFVQHFPCQNGFYDCCCGTFQACLESSWQCAQFCS